MLLSSSLVGVPCLIHTLARCTIRIFSRISVFFSRPLSALCRLPRGGRLRDLGDGNSPEPADVIVIALQESAYHPRGWDGGSVGGSGGEAVDEKALLKASGQDLQDQFFQVGVQKTAIVKSRLLPPTSN